MDRRGVFFYHTKEKVGSGKQVKISPLWDLLAWQKKPRFFRITSLAVVFFSRQRATVSFPIKHTKWLDHERKTLFEIRLFTPL